MENRNIAFLFQLLLNLEAARRRDVLEVDASEASADQIDRVDDLIDVVALDAQRERVHSAECLEQDALSFHNRHPGFRADIPEAQNRRSVRDNEYEIRAAGQIVALVDILLNLETRRCDARRICEREVVFRLDRNGRDNLDFTLPLLVKFE